jgi:hypothetical protein
MINSNLFIRQTAEIASFAFREYFRPLVAVARFLKPRPASSELVECGPEYQTSLEQAQAILKQRLAKGRHYEKLLLTQAIIASLASLLGLVLSLMHAFDVKLLVVSLILLPLSTFAVWVTIRLARNREVIVELKTIRWVMKSLDKETAASVARQVIWGKSKKKRSPRKDEKTF